MYISYQFDKLGYKHQIIWNIIIKLLRQCCMSISVLNIDANLFALKHQDELTEYTSAYIIKTNTFTTVWFELKEESDSH